MFPTRVAVIEEMKADRKLTNGELRNKVLSTASFLRSHGFGRGDRAAIAIRNTIEFPIFHLGVWAAGGAIVGSSVAFKAHETEYQLRDSAPKIILTTDDYLPTVLDVLKKCSSVEMVICIRNSAIKLPEGVIDFNSVINHAIDEERSKAHLEDVALIYYTSGTTGLRKGVIHTHKSFHTAAESIRSHWEHEIYPALGLDEIGREQEYQLLTTPSYHLMGFSILNAFLICGSPISMLKDFQDGVLLKCIEKYKPSFIIGHPAMVMYLTKEETAKLSSIKLIVSSGSYLRESTANAFLRRFPHVDYVVQGYGLTELSFCHLPVLFHKGYNSSAGVVSSVFRQKIVDVETHQLCRQGERGEVFLTGPAQTLGYLNRPQCTAELFDAEGWVSTGDIGYADELGQLHIVDRTKEMMKVNHNNVSSQVSPSEIEVADVGVIGIPHEERESLFRAYVVKEDDSLTAAEVENVVSVKLSDYKFITGGVRFIDKIPRSPVGKMLRRELQALSL